MEHLAVLDLEPLQLLTGETADEQIVLPAGVLVARVERDAARRHARRPVPDRIVHPGLAGLGDPWLNALGRDAPAVVVLWLDDVDLVSARRAVLRLPQLPGHRIPCESLRISMSVAPNRLDHVRLADVRIVFGHRAVVVDAMDLAGRLRQIL